MSHQWVAMLKNLRWIWNMNLRMTQRKALRNSNKKHHNIIYWHCIFTKKWKLIIKILIVVLMGFIHRIPFVDKWRNRSWSRWCGVCSWFWALRSGGHRETPGTFFSAKTVIVKKMIKVTFCLHGEFEHCIGLYFILVHLLSMIWS